MSERSETGKATKSYGVAIRLPRKKASPPAHSAPAPQAVLDAIATLVDLAARRGASLPEKDFAPALTDFPNLPDDLGGPFRVFPFANLDQTTDELLQSLVGLINSGGLGYGYEAAICPAVGLSPADAWCPKEASYPHLGTTTLARSQLSAANTSDLEAYGENVFVVIVDQGINKDVLEKRVTGARFGGGWRAPDPQPGSISLPYTPPLKAPGTWPDGHGTRMAEVVLSIAPKATILDLPLLPQRIRDPRGFLPWAAWMFWSLSRVIQWAKNTDRDWPWVLCNAWTVYDLRRDFPANSPWNYGTNPGSLMNRAIQLLSRGGLADVMFAAGNSGQFCPDRRAASGQIGPGRSIYGAAALRRVLTVGAVRNDQTWLGYSAQGPSPVVFLSQKPDLVAPSQFTATKDAARGYGGTSAACALAAGAFAAARSLPHNRMIAPAEMIERAVETARPLVGVRPDPSRIGAGMLHVPGLLHPSA